MKNIKVFVIGFHKTGTTTMENALEELGYNVCGLRPDLLEDLKQKNYSRIYKIISKYDGFQDNPWPLFYEFLDKNIENSKFILTVRDPEKWLRSIMNHCRDRSTPMREYIYGIGNPSGNEKIYFNRLMKHNLEVNKYFNGRNNFIEFNLEKGDGWEKLCDFLGEKRPNTDFPHANRGTFKKNEHYIKKFKVKMKKFNNLVKRFYKSN